MKTALRNMQNIGSTTNKTRKTAALHIKIEANILNPLISLSGMADTIHRPFPTLAASITGYMCKRLVSDVNVCICKLQPTFTVSRNHCIMDNCIVPVSNVIVCISEFGGLTTETYPMRAGPQHPSVRIVLGFR